MKNIISKWQSWSPEILSILRIILAINFMTYGSMKLFGWPMSMPEGFVLETFSMIWWAGVLEFFGGILLILGLGTRTTAFILSGEMAFAYFMGHAGNAFWPVINNGTPALVYCFIWLYISTRGGGAWTLDKVLCRKKM